jgi:FkbM family methyltransferase
MRIPALPHATPRQLDLVRRRVYRRELAVLSCLEIEVDGRTLRYSAAEGSRLIQGRVTTIFAKEPTTIPYLETFEPDEVFLDVGANIGLYSVYAAAMTGCRVYCLEPEALNFAELNKNIYLNGLNDRVLAFCAAAGDEPGVGELLLGAFAVGYSHHDYGESTWQTDMKWSEEVSVKPGARIRQGSICVSIDDLVASGTVPQPHHIKIDVDGHEPKVIRGAQKTLASPALKTVLVEVDFKSDACQAIVDEMTQSGWLYSADQLVTNRTFVMKHERIDQLRQLKKDGFNYIFYRDPAYGEYFTEFLARYEPPLNSAGKLKLPPQITDE